MKIVQIEFVQAVTLPGTKVLGMNTINPNRLPDTTVTVSKEGTYVTIQCSGKTGIVPMQNVRSAMIETEEKAKK